MPSLSLLLSLFVLVGAAANAGAAEPAPASAPADQEAAAKAMLDGFIAALQLADFEQAAKGALPFLHKSLLNKTGDDLSGDLRKVGFKKAHSNAKQYAHPVKIARVRPTGAVSVGFKDTAEPGIVHDYFIAKKDGGLPSPIKVFFPAAGGAPKVSYLGSL